MSNVYLPKLVTHKYDEMMDYHITMYDNLPYRRNPDFCGIQQVALYSGHIIKYYLCLNHAEEYKVDNHDGEIEHILAIVKKKEEERKILMATISSKNSEEEEDIPKTKIHTRLEDNDSSPAGFAGDNDNLAGNNTINAFDGVEDW